MIKAGLIDSESCNGTRIPSKGSCHLIQHDTCERSFTSVASECFCIEERFIRNVLSSWLLRKSANLAHFEIWWFLLLVRSQLSKFSPIFFLLLSFLFHEKWFEFFQFRICFNLTRKKAMENFQIFFVKKSCHRKMDTRWRSRSWFLFIYRNHRLHVLRRILSFTNLTTSM